MTLDKKNVVYVGGDSFTAGEDITDYLLPEYSEYSTAEMTELLKTNSNPSDGESWISVRDKFYSDPNNQGLYDQHNKIRNNLRWSNKLEEIINQPVLNMSSIGGSSMYAIGYRAAYDLELLKKQGYTVTDVIIQLTNASRFYFFTNQKFEIHKNGIDYKICSITSGTNQFTDIFDTTIKHEDFYYNVYRLFYEIYQIEKMIESIIGKKPIFVDSVFFSDFIHSVDFFKIIKDITIANEHQFIRSYAEELEKRLELSMLDCVADHDEKIWTKNLHFNSKIHQRFAKLVADRYFNH
jgi:hypothetical protein